MKTITLSLLVLVQLSAQVSAQSVPYISSVLINSCNGSCSEGDNEIIFGNTGLYSVLATPANIQISYGTTTNPTTGYTDNLTNNATTTATLNAVAACGSTLLIDAANTTIPPNSTFIVVKSSICSNALNWSGLCGTGPIYIIYSTDPTWVSGGNFGNGTGTTRYFRSIITSTTGVSSTVQYSYTLPSSYSNDGAYATWTASGGSASTYGDNDCNLTPVLLPVELLRFSATLSDNNVQLNWETSSEIRTESFVIEHASELDFNFQPIASIFKKGDETNGAIYQLETNQVVYGTNYYRLKSVDVNLAIHELDTKVVILKADVAYFNNEDQQLHCPHDGIFGLYSLDGRLLESLSGASTYSLSHHGIFLLVDELHQTPQHLFIP